MQHKAIILDNLDFSKWNLDTTNVLNKLFKRAIQEILKEALEDKLRACWFDEDGAGEDIIIELPLGPSSDDAIRWKLSLREYLVEGFIDWICPYNGSMDEKTASRLKHKAEIFRSYALRLEEVAANGYDPE